MRAKRRRLDRIVEALASDDKQQRRSRALLFDEATTATNEQCGGVTVAQEHRPGAVDPLHGRIRPKVLLARNRLQRSTFRPLASSATGTIVQSLSDDADALIDCAHEKDLQTQAFSRAAVRRDRASLGAAACFRARGPVVDPARSTGRAEDVSELLAQPARWASSVRGRPTACGLAMGGKRGAAAPPLGSEITEPWRPARGSGGRPCPSRAGAQ
jgi:hypothetical protein